MTAGAWRRLDTALQAWADAGRSPAFWLRDDDAAAPTPALARLIDLAEIHAVPLALAVIPAHATPALAGSLRERISVTVLVHGWSHENHAPPGEKKQELGPHRPQAQVLDDLRRAEGRIDTLFGDLAVKVLVPPWNRIDAALLPRLPGLGFRAVSVFGPPRPAALRMLNATVDIMDWHGTRGCREPGAILGEIVAQLEAGLSRGEPQPIGLLTHHLVHDETAWAFIAELFAATAGRAGIGWKSVGALLAERAAPA